VETLDIELAANFQVIVSFDTGFSEIGAKDHTFFREPMLAFEPWRRFRILQEIAEMPGKHRHLMDVNRTPEAEKRGRMMAALETVVPVANEVRICAVSY
jgi:hypothetical protein